jgi:hypothetical protein
MKGSRGIRDWLLFLAAVFVVACAHMTNPATPTLAFVPGRFSDGSSMSCAPVSFPEHSGARDEICFDTSDAIEVPRREIYSTRIEDRTIDDRTRYLVSAYLPQPFRAFCRSISSSCTSRGNTQL